MSLDKLESFLYATPQPNKKRTVPMRVICAGLSRSGTESLQRALQILGFNDAYHGWGVLEPGGFEFWVRIDRKKFHPPPEAKGDSAITREDFDLMLGDCQAICDFCAAHYVEDLITAYPEAKVVLNKRSDLDAWYKSVQATFCTAKPRGFTWFRNLFGPTTYWRNAFYYESMSSFYFGNMEGTAKWRYREHMNAIRSLMPKEKLLEWSVQDGWGPLCEFLEVPIPDVPFPTGNVPADFMNKIAKSRAAADRQANRNMALVGASILGIGTALWLRLRRHQD